MPAHRLRVKPWRSAILASVAALLTAAAVAMQSLAGRNGTLCHSIISNVHEQFVEQIKNSSRFFDRK